MIKKLNRKSQEQDYKIGLKLFEIDATFPELNDMNIRGFQKAKDSNEIRDPRRLC